MTTTVGLWASWLGDPDDAVMGAFGTGAHAMPDSAGSGAEAGGVGGVGGGAGRGGGGGGGYAGTEPGAKSPGWEAPSGAAKYLTSPEKQEVAKSVVDEWRKAGASDAAIAGVLANLRDETGFVPGLRHYDQPRYSRRDERGYAHGLYQEGAEEWSNMEKWLGGRDWRDPRLQSQFVIKRLKESYRDTWERMNRGTKEEAARAFLEGYLKPAVSHRQARATRYGHGVPGIEFYTRGAGGQASVGGPRAGGGSRGFYQGSGRPLGSAQAHFGRSGHVDTRMDPVLVERLNAAYAAAPAGQKFRVISGYRSPALQANLYNRYKRGVGGVAAPPGRSQHNFGRAADIGRGRGFNWLHRNASRFGLVFPHSFDQPHIQVAP